MARIFYIMGASGAGKDTLLHYARKHLPKQAPIAFAHRYITRPADAGGENHVSLSPSEFALRQQAGCFAMHWQSHTSEYAIGREIDLWVAAGLSVVISGSRTYLPEALRQYPPLIPIYIHANREVLHQRLLARGRESTQEIDERLSATSIPTSINRLPNLISIENNGAIETAGDQLVKALLAL